MSIIAHSPQQEHHLQNEIAACEGYEYAHPLSIIDRISNDVKKSHKYQQLPLISEEDFLAQFPEHKEDDENAKNNKQREALTERGANVREVERTEALLKRQLAKWAERTDTLREQSQEKAQNAKEKMEELRAIHKQLSEERSQKAKDIERRRVRIEQTEKKVSQQEW